MQPAYGAALREIVPLRMSPPNRDSVAGIARDTGITAQNIYNWRSQWRPRAAEKRTSETCSSPQRFGPSCETSAGLGPRAAGPPQPGKDGVNPLRVAAPPWIRSGPGCRRPGAAPGGLLEVHSGQVFGGWL
jgi:hypothetical protein